MNSPEGWKQFCLLICNNHTKRTQANSRPLGGAGLIAQKRDRVLKRPAEHPDTQASSISTRLECGIDGSNAHTIKHKKNATPAACGAFH